MGGIGDPYVDLAEFKAYLVGQANATLTGQDAQLTDALESASREIEAYCARQFNRSDSATPREFEPAGRDYAMVDDFHTATGLVVRLDTSGDGSFATILSPQQYELSPANGVVDGMEGWPFYRIRLLSGTTFPCHYGGRSRTLQVTARWGWADVPPPVRAACRIMAAETWKLKDAPFGVLGLDEFGIVRVRQNKLAVSKLAPYSKTRLLIG
ncbi:hypothetical protein [Streptomyces hydrogenans]|uniref:Phage gp6-like head-tail connector protein n=1 Tax=Streptomyces hydrogenans TaxID=1873719 RepID=A0ABQ3PJS7_9ACTN|nr:hypothetical protein [Streptomyces hydrogenans]GHG09721.1 hypothetical protein GCM10018784_22900 [Streptomyces hydrogenans]GHI25258.1 hypothetical protein Shyd_66290 [Streptomyces hydrogenans]